MACSNDKVVVETKTQDDEEEWFMMIQTGGMIQLGVWLAGYTLSLVFPVLAAYFTWKEALMAVNPINLPASNSV